MTRIAVVRVLARRRLRQGSAADVARALEVTPKVAQALLAQLVRLGEVRSLGVRDRRGWTLFALKRRPTAPSEVRAALQTRNPLRTLVGTYGWLPVARAVRALEEAA